MKRVLTVMDRVSTNGHFKITYYKTDCSRLYTNEGISLQSCWRYIRQTLSYGTYVDIDMVNAHPTILHGIAVDGGIRLKYLEKYVRDRDRVVGEVVGANPGLTRGDVKKYVLAVLNGGNNYVSKFTSKDFISGIAKDSETMRNFIAPGDDFALQKRKVSFEMMRRENLILGKCVEVVRKHGVKSMVLIFDGFQVPIGSNVT